MFPICPDIHPSACAKPASLQVCTTLALQVPRATPYCTPIPIPTSSTPRLPTPTCMPAPVSTSYRPPLSSPQANMSFLPFHATLISPRPYTSLQLRLPRQPACPHPAQAPGVSHAARSHHHSPSPLDRPTPTSHSLHQGLQHASLVCSHCSHPRQL